MYTVDDLNFKSYEEPALFSPGGKRSYLFQLRPLDGL
jgi:hypothetical protein